LLDEVFITLQSQANQHMLRLFDSNWHSMFNLVGIISLPWQK